MDTRAANESEYTSDEINLKRHEKVGQSTEKTRHTGRIWVIYLARDAESHKI